MEAKVENTIWLNSKKTEVSSRAVEPAVFPQRLRAVGSVGLRILDWIFCSQLVVRHSPNQYESLEDLKRKHNSYGGLPWRP